MEEPRTTTRIRTKKQKLSSISDPFSNLPRDVLMNILIKLPVTTILHCTVVCKEFRTTILDPRFPEAHYEDQVASSRYSLVSHQSSDNPDQLVVIEGYNSKSRVKSNEVRVGQITGFHSFKVVNSCRGFLLLQDMKQEKRDWFRFYVYNPLTDQHWKVPEVIMNDHSTDYFSQSGLGFSSRTKQLKIVKFVPRKVSSSSKDLEIHTVGSSEGWRRLKIKEGYGETVLAKINTNDNNPLELNGALHWLAGSDRIASFDVEKEELGVITASPCFEHGGKYATGISAVQGLLCLGIKDIGNSRNGVELWIMKEYGVKESWTKYVVIKDLGVRSWWNPKVVQVYDDGKMLVLSRYPRSNLVVYDPKNKSYKGVRVEGVCVAMMAELHIPSFFTCGNFSTHSVVNRLSFKENISNIQTNIKELSSLRQKFL